MKKVLHILEVLGISLFIVAGIVYFAIEYDNVSTIAGVNLGLILEIILIIFMICISISICKMEKLDKEYFKLNDEAIDINYKYIQLLQEEYESLQEQVEDLNERIAQLEEQLEVGDTQDLDCMEDNE